MHGLWCMWVVVLLAGWAVVYHLHLVHIICHGVQQVSTWNLWADNSLIYIYKSRISLDVLHKIKVGQARGESLGDKTLTYSTTCTASDVHQLVPLSKNESFAQASGRARHKEGIYSFIWLDFRWIYGKPYSVQVYPEDMTFIKSRLMCVELLLLCGSMCPARAYRCRLRSRRGTS